MKVFVTSTVIVIMAFASCKKTDSKTLPAISPKSDSTTPIGTKPPNMKTDYYYGITHVYDRGEGYQYPWTDSTYIDSMKIRRNYDDSTISFYSLSNGDGTQYKMNITDVYIVYPYRHHTTKYIIAGDSLKGGNFHSACHYQHNISFAGIKQSRH